MRRGVREWQAGGLEQRNDRVHDRARCLEVEVASHGASIEEALSALQEALELYVEDEPTAEVFAPPIIASVEVNAGPKSTAA